MRRTARDTEESAKRVNRRALLMGLAGQVSLGHAAFFAVGAYTQAILVTKTEVPGLLAAVIAPVSPGVAGVLGEAAAWPARSAAATRSTCPARHRGPAAR